MTVRWMENVGCVEADGETIQILFHLKSAAPPTSCHPAEAYENQIVDMPSMATNL